MVLGDTFAIRDDLKRMRFKWEPLFRWWRGPRRREADVRSLLLAWDGTATPDHRMDMQVYSKVIYKSRVYYSIGRSKNKHVLTPINGEFQFQVASDLVVETHIFVPVDRSQRARRVSLRQISEANQLAKSLLGRLGWSIVCESCNWEISYGGYWCANCGALTRGRGRPVADPDDAIRDHTLSSV